MDQPLVYQRLRRRRSLMLLALAAVFAASLAADAMMGSSRLTLAQLFGALWAGPDAAGPASIVVWRIRLPMTLTCVFVGASLGLAGLQLQTITGNPLASPYTFGITASASFGAAISITTGFTVLGQLWLGTSLLACAFALLVAICIYYMGKQRGLSTTTLILTGIVMNFLFTAMQQYIQYRSSPEIAQIITSWTFGNLARSTWTSVALSGAVLVGCAAVLMGWSWRLTALSAGEEKAESLGVNVGRLRFSVFALSAVLTAGAVSFIGTVAFVGLVAPHCARLLAGDDQRYLLPLSMLCGSAMLLLSSIVSKLLTVGSMLPVGIITSFVGVPFLIVLLLRKRE